MKTFVLIISIWLGTIAVLICFGYWNGEGEARYNPSLTNDRGYHLACRAEQAVLAGGFGFGLATPVLLCLLFVHLARRKHVRKRWGILAEGLSVILIPVLGVYGMSVASDAINARVGPAMAPFRVLEGEAGLSLIVVGIVSFCIAVSCLAAFSAWAYIHRDDQTA